MNRFGRVGIALALLAGVLLAGGVAEARRLPYAVAVCVDASSGVASRLASSAKCVGGKQVWSATKSAPLLCWNSSPVVKSSQKRVISIAPTSGCAAPLRSVPVNKVVLLCADGKSGVLRWPVTGACASGNRQTWIRSAATVAPTTTTVAPTTSTTVTPTTSTTVTPTTSTTVTPSTPTTVAVSRAAVGTERRTAFTTQPQISIRDSSGSTVTSSSAVVTATVSAGGTLVGTTTAAAVSGVATFSGLGVDGTIGTTYTITYTVSGLTVATATVALTGTTCDGSFTCQVGDTGSGGGIVFYVQASGGTFTSTGSDCGTACKYLEAAPSDHSSTVTWCSNHLSPVGDNAAGIGSGMSNTTTADSTCTGSVAIQVAADYTNNSKADWYLPSKDELNELCKYAKNTGQAVGGGTLCYEVSSATLRGFSDGSYWSSSEYDGSTAWAQNFYRGDQINLLKDLARYVRPVRAF